MHDSERFPRDGAPLAADTLVWAHGHAAPLEYHRVLIDDPIRLEAYERALRALVRPGDVVLDLGAGTGVLAMLAARRGAARVHALESMPIAALAEALVRANGLAETVRVHRADALALAPVEPVDLVVSDFLGRFVVDDGMLPAMTAAGRWLKPGGRFCPSEVALRVAPVGDVRLRAVDLFEESRLGLDLRAAKAHALHYAYHAALDPEAAMAPAATYATLRPPVVPTFDATLTFELARDGRLQGLAGWFDATLAEGVVLSTAPGIVTHWGQYLFPLPPVAARTGDVLGVRLRLEVFPHDMVWVWEGALTRDGAEVVAFALDTVQRLDGTYGPEGAR